MFRLARSHQSSTRRARQRHSVDALFHMLHVVDQSWEQGCLRGNAQPCQCCTHGDLHHLDRLRASQTTAWRGPPFGPLVTWPIRTRCEHHCFGLHQLVGKFMVCCNTFSQLAHTISSSSGRSGPLRTTSTARRSTGHARCFSFFWGARF